MNAEAKKKVDVLSEELLPYIIAEQERRTTLHKRVMTAIQNGEKGVTVAEIRNKPPLIIRKANRAPKEPDGSGVLGCEDDITPTQIMYDSCLSPDLPRNGSTVIGCAPIERTSLNYTTSKCTLEDTDDVVVHYRYYPDRAKNTNQSIEIDMENPKPQDFGDYFAIFQNGDGQEERVKILTVRYIVIKISRFDASYEVGEHYDTTISYQCDSCDLTDILCNGESVLAAGRVSIVSVYKHQQQLLTEIVTKQLQKAAVKQPQPVVKAKRPPLRRWLRRALKLLSQALRWPLMSQSRKLVRSQLGRRLLLLEGIS
ncbi:hypothetical protein MSG28_015931, partial [Choristoneura fumiferana]